MMINDFYSFVRVLNFCRLFVEYHLNLFEIIDMSGFSSAKKMENPIRRLKIYIKAKFKLLASDKISS
jgi:hypothetical protein